MSPKIGGRAWLTGTLFRERFALGFLPLVTVDLFYKRPRAGGSILIRAEQVKEIKKTVLRLANSYASDGIKIDIVLQALEGAAREFEKEHRRGYPQWWRWTIYLATAIREKNNAG